MHNLLLGTAKHAIEVWKSTGIINTKHLEEIQEKVNSFNCPNDIGCIPSKIQSSFSGFSTDHWKNWTVLFSLYSLKEILPPQHYNCFLLFVKSCSLLCHRSLTATQLSEADDLLNRFCYKFFTALWKRTLHY